MLRIRCDYYFFIVKMKGHFCEIFRYINSTNTKNLRTFMSATVRGSVTGSDPLDWLMGSKATESSPPAGPGTPQWRGRRLVGDHASLLTGRVGAGSATLPDGVRTGDVRICCKGPDLTGKPEKNR